MKKVLFALALLSCGSSGLAAPISYDVSRSIGSGTVIGSITTDGTLGVLAASDILDWTLQLDDGSGTYTLLGPVSGSNSDVLLTGGSVTATASALTFDYGNYGALLFQAPSPGSGRDFWCQQGQDVDCFTESGVGEAVDVTSDFPGQQVARSGSVVFATAAVVAPTSVPEPATVALLGLGIVGYAATRRRRPTA